MTEQKACGIPALRAGAVLTSQTPDGLAHLMSDVGDCTVVGHDAAAPERGPAVGAQPGQRVRHRLGPAYQVRQSLLELLVREHLITKDCAQAPELAGGGPGR